MNSSQFLSGRGGLSFLPRINEQKTVSCIWYCAPSTVQKCQHNPTTEQ